MGKIHISDSRLDRLDMAVVLSKWIQKPHFLSATEHLRPLSISLFAENPSRHVFGFDHEHAESRDEYVVDLRCAVGRWEGYVVNRHVDGLRQRNHCRYRHLGFADVPLAARRAEQCAQNPSESHLAVAIRLIHVAIGKDGSLSGNWLQWTARFSERHCPAGMRSTSIGSDGIENRRFITQPFRIFGSFWLSWSNSSPYDVSLSSPKNLWPGICRGRAYFAPRTIDEGETSL